MRRARCCRPLFIGHLLSSLCSSPPLGERLGEGLRAIFDAPPRLASPPGGAEEHEQRRKKDGLDGRRDGGAAPLDRARAHGGGRPRDDGRPADRRDLRSRSGQLQARRRAAAALVHGVLRRDCRADRSRAGWPPQEGHRAAADPDAAPHGRRPARAGSWAGCAWASPR